MSQQESKKSNFNFERKKRTYKEMEEISDEDILVDENFPSDTEKDSKKNKQSKNMKIINNNSDYHTLRQMRLIQKNKENNLLSQDQLDFAKKIVEYAKVNESKGNVEVIGLGKNNINSKSNISLPNQKNFPSNKQFQFTSNDNFSIIEQNKNQSDLNFKEIMECMGYLNSYDCQIFKNNQEVLSLQIKIERNANEYMIFLLNFNKQGEEKDFVDYLPLNCTFQLEGEDVNFKEELEIHKEDLGKLMKRLLNYKFRK